MKLLHSIVPTALLVALVACGEHGHDHEDGDGDHAAPAAPVALPHGEADDHGHDESPLGTIQVDGFSVELAQGHGAVVAGREGHLVVKLPYSDRGDTVVRAWIGTEDRILSLVGKGQYAASHDDYDVHATAPDPLPEDVRWWVELETPTGERHLGSAKPLLD